MSQERFVPAAPVSEHRVDALARVIAGMRWPGAGSFEKLKKPQIAAAREAARRALEHVAMEP